MQVWRLIVWDVPDRLGGLLARYGFKPTRKNPAHWSRVFDPALDRPSDPDSAASIREALLAQGLKGRWFQTEQKPKPYTPRHGQPLDLAKHNKHVGSWRRKASSRK